VAQLAEAEIAPLKARIQTLAGREYIFGADHVLVDLGPYDADRQAFNIALRSRPAGKGAAQSPLKLAFNGSLSLPPAEARQFKQQWAAGLVRAEVTATPEGGAKTAQLLNEADGSRRWHHGDEFVTEMEKQYRPAMRLIPSGGFEIAQTEVTQAQWRAVMGYNPSHFSSCGDDCPVEQVSWGDVQEYLRKLNKLSGKQYRLPTEHEWKHACDGGSSQEYCGSSNLDAVGWYDKNSGNKTHPVGQKQANGYGLYDMSGNVWEWQQDCYNGDCSKRVLRGGSWHYGPGFARSASRDWSSPAGLLVGYGFRLARSARTY
jgi:formylglycine-generating enzyme required for sulfatase activity